LIRYLKGLSRAKQGSIWVGGGYALSQLVRLGSNVLLAALLFPEAFALMGIIAALLAGMTMLSDVGIGPSIIQNARGTQRSFLATAWTLQLVRGVLLFVIVCLATPLVVAIYTVNDPMGEELRWLLPLVGSTLIITGLMSTRYHVCIRNLDIARITIAEVVAQLISALVTVIIAWQTGSLVSLAIGAITHASLLVGLTHLYLPGKPDQLSIDPEALHDIWHYGKWVFLSTAISFLSMQADKLMMPRLFSLEQAGVYAIAVGLSSIASAVIGRMQHQIVFPRLSELFSQKKTFAESTISLRHYTYGGSALLCWAVAVLAPHFIQIFYDARYHDAAAYFALLAFSAWLTTVDGFYGAGFLASGRPRLVAFTNLVKFLVFIALVIPFSQMWGVIGAIFAMVVADAARAGVNLILAAQLGFSGLRTDLTYLGVFLLGLGLLTFLSSLVGERFSLSRFTHAIIDAGMLLLTISGSSLVFHLAKLRGSHSLN
jgi:O-antigen/teichoic acid export membrane protein